MLCPFFSFIAPPPTKQRSAVAADAGEVRYFCHRRARHPVCGFRLSVKPTMIYVDETDPDEEPEPPFEPRQVKLKKNQDVKSEYTLRDELGRGKFGTVYRCEEKKTGRVFAAKFILTQRAEDRADVEREVEIMRSLQHPRLLQLYDAFDDSKKQMILILEMIEGGELFERVIDDDFVLTEKACAIFVRQICEGVDYMHSKNILHLDMKPENVLCTTRTGNRIKLIDFGLARFYEPEKKLQVLFGTPEFVAPEVVNFDKVSYQTDMWSVGVICYVLLSGLSPFMGNSELETMANVTRAEYDFDDESFDAISEEAKDFIAKLLLKDKDDRMTAAQCLNHPWLRVGVTTPTPIKDIEAPEFQEAVAENGERIFGSQTHGSHHLPIYALNAEKTSDFPRPTMCSPCLSSQLIFDERRLTSCFIEPCLFLTTLSHFLEMEQDVTHVHVYLTVL
ncbi:hypothetical protein V5799_023031 [Amblyomma americanum]|uniref:Protein kinase domain-containing protein n=1 Tax=Amblyomma americanum TaxID=6943 RepID=A0AAQ4FIQ2_AMBAM